MNKQYTILVLLMITMLFTGCSQESEKITSQPNINIFKSDGNTIKDLEESEWLNQIASQRQETEKNAEDSQEYVFDEPIGELNIEDNSTPKETSSTSSTEEDDTDNNENTEEDTTENENNTEEDTTENIDESDIPSEFNGVYTVQGDNVIYNNITYNNLYKAVNDVYTDSPYSADALIKTILKCYPTSEEVWVDSNTTESLAQDEYSMGLDYEISTYEDYKYIQQKYNESVTWRLTIRKFGFTDVIDLYGCSQYVILIGAPEDSTVDVTYFE